MSNPFGAVAPQQAPAPVATPQFTAPAPVNGEPQFGGAPQQFAPVPQPQYQAPVTNPGGHGADQFATPGATQPPAPTNGAVNSDPFAEPAGPGNGERVKDMVGSLLIVKPLEIIFQMKTSQGLGDAIRADIAILDNTASPGHVAIGVLIFQKPLIRDLKRVLDGNKPYLLGRLARGGKDTDDPRTRPYIFVTPTDADKHLAKQFLEVYGQL